MTAPLESRPLVNAILAMIDVGLPSTIGIYWAGAPTNAATPYAVLYPDIGMESASDRSLSDDVPNDLRFQVTSVGTTPDQAALVADKVATILLTTVPTVAGRRVRPIRQEAAQPVRRDDESTTHFIATAQYLARSDRT
ncbi:hypothetical protein ACFXJ8_26015 [Nonomuraea sp. NPDC059194]|uniref:tail completion protein gp17 n=1 Tax=Nonomuraea sp. NPDC059194 TaxID=3346764 RepID=UPI00368BD95A